MAEKKESKKKKHLHQIRSVQAEDGSIVHHHSYKDSPDDPNVGPERMMATSNTPDEAAQHVQEQFAMNGAGADQPQADPTADQSAAAPDAGAA